MSELLVFIGALWRAHRLTAAPRLTGNTMMAALCPTAPSEHDEGPSTLGHSLFEQAAPSDLDSLV